ncbi:MAG: hypothetical protein A4E53_03100 [Pelotomaculum sp. PtaB.Bin104]|nr:MAG: hypothetical protein A4E53_03100 [Pelotomaculum sp. PtaB.Bin104]
MLLSVPHSNIQQGSLQALATLVLKDSELLYDRNSWSG